MSKNVSRREIRLFKLSKKGNGQIHRNSFRKIKAIFVEVGKGNKKAA